MHEVLMKSQNNITPFKLKSGYEKMLNYRKEKGVYILRPLLCSFSTIPLFISSFYALEFFLLFSNDLLKK